MNEEQREPEPAAQTNLGPAPHSGGEKEFGDRLVPPYQDRQTEAKPNRDELEAKVHNAETEGGQPGSGREISDEERAGVADTDTTGASPLGVGESITPQGNEQALGGEEGGGGRKGDEADEARRKDREEAGIKPDPPISDDMPNLRPGDQGG